MNNQQQNRDTTYKCNKYWIILGQNITIFNYILISIQYLLISLNTSDIFSGHHFIDVSKFLKINLNIAGFRKYDPSDSDECELNQ